MTIQQLRKELMAKYEPMRCANVLEFNHRLQWLSEGMLHNHLYPTNERYTINQHEIELYKEFCEKRLTLKKNGV